MYSILDSVLIPQHYSTHTNCTYTLVKLFLAFSCLKGVTSSSGSLEHDELLLSSVQSSSFDVSK